MTALKLTLIFFLLLAGQARADDDWTQADTVRQVIASALMAVDWSQTLYAVDHTDKYGENNPNSYGENNFLLGRHPSRASVNTYFVIAIPANYAIARWLSPKWRPYFQYLTIGIEAAAVGNNARIGIKFYF